MKIKGQTKKKDGFWASCGFGLLKNKKEYEEK